MEALARRNTAVDDVAEFAAAATRFADAAAATDLRLHVPTCGRWTAYDLVVHLGNVHAWAATVVETGHPAAEQNDEPSAHRGKAVSRWYTGKAEDLFAVLRHTPPDRPCWNFAYGAGTVQFWPRRQLHETTMHLVDLELASGRSTRLSPAVCVDGIDEATTAMMHRMHRRGHPAALSAPLALVAIDSGDTWVISPGGRHSAETVVPLQAAGGTAAPPVTAHRREDAHEVTDRVEAPADVLYRMLWKRPVRSDAVTVYGDRTRVEAFLGSRLTP